MISASFVLFLFMVAIIIVVLVLILWEVFKLSDKVDKWLDNDDD